MHSSAHTLDSVYSQKIVHDQINRSHSKQKYSFPKEERFNYIKKSYCKSSSYQLGSSLNKRTTNLGYGNKSDFTKGDQDKPGPDRYSVVSIFQVENSKKKGFTFSLGRDEIKFRQIPSKAASPGPGFYELDDSTKSRKYLYTIGQRTPNPFTQYTSKGVPGPATYESIGMNQTGSYFVSKFSGSKASVFSPPTSTRFSYVTKNKFIPGPGAYNFETFRQDGTYYNSKLRSVAGGRFALGSRKTYVSKDAILSPGPGAYRVLSEFGDTDFPPIKTPKHQLSKSQSVYSFKNSSTMRSTAYEKQNTQKNSQRNIQTEMSHQINNNSNQKNLEIQV